MLVVSKLLLLFNQPVVL